MIVIKKRKKQLKDLFSKIYYIASKTQSLIYFLNFKK